LKADQGTGAPVCPLPKFLQDAMRINVIAIRDRHYLMSTREQTIEETGFQESQQVFFRLTVF
ncbi:MAG: hypothetical protein WA477_03330, partial [Candidatus Sulfotelmatobacter sp.]